MAWKEFKNTGKIFRNGRLNLLCGVWLLFALVSEKADIARAEENSCVGISNGRKFQDPLDCHGYFICFQGQSYQTYCDHSEKFDEAAQRCVEGKCPPCRECKNDCSTPTTTPTKSPIPDDTCNGRSDGEMIRDSVDCNKFYVCVSGKSIGRQCPAGLSFDSTINVCNYPALVNCGPNPTPKPTTTSTTSNPPIPTSGPPTKSPLCAGLNSGDMRRDPDNCSKYIMCMCDSVLSVFTCSEGLLFDTTTGTCNFANKVNCPGITTPTTTTQSPSTRCGGLNNGERIRDPYDCSAFYECRLGAMQLQRCRSGYYFEKAVNGCKPRAEVYCELDIPTPSTPTTTTTTQPPATPSTRCGELYNGDRIRDPYDCAAFYECRVGLLQLRRCSSGYYYEAAIKGCRPRAEVFCELDIPTPSTQTTTTITTTTTTTPSPVTPSTRCGGLNNGERIRDPYDCAAFYECRLGVMQLKRCRSGYYFEKAISGCKPRNEVFCELPTPTTTTTTMTTRPPNVCDIYPGFAMIRDSIDCSKFYVCCNGYSSVHQCPAGLSFDTTTNMCNYNNLVNCGPNPTPKPTTTSTTPNPLIPTSGPPTKSPLCVGLNTGEMRRDPNNCAKYFMCMCDSVVYFTCPQGLLFDTTTSTCNLPYKVNCTSAPTTTTQSPAPPSTRCGELYNGERIRYPSDCAAFYECRLGVMQVKRCRSGYYFEKAISGCKPRNEVFCELPTPTTTTTTALTPPPTPKETLCSCFTGYKVFRSPESCAQVFICNYGVPQILTCSSGENFDMTNGVCRPISSVDCKIGGSITSPAIVAPTGTSSNVCEGITEKVFRDPSNCGKVTICYRGTKRIHTCNSGMFFDMVRRACDNKDRVDCSIGDIEAVAKPTASINVCEGQTGQTIIRDPSDYTKVIICDYGTTRYYTCPSGKYFDWSIWACK